MKYRISLFIISLMILQGCSAIYQEVNISSGVQYIGEDENIISELEKLKITYQNSPKIDLDATNNKFILIEPYHIKDISKEDLEKALDKGFYVFFINMVNDKELKEKFFNQQSYEMTKDEKTWVEQIYYGNIGLTSLNISTKANITENLSKWLTTLDKFKKESK
jgi:hypothetical protein